MASTGPCSKPPQILNHYREYGLNVAKSVFTTERPIDYPLKIDIRGRFSQTQTLGSENIKQILTAINSSKCRVIARGYQHYCARMDPLWILMRNSSLASDGSDARNH